MQSFMVNIKTTVRLRVRFVYAADGITEVIEKRNTLMSDRPSALVTKFGSAH